MLHNETQTYAEIERHTAKGVDVVLCIDPFDIQTYKNAIKNIDPNEYVLMYWGDKTYRDTMGNLSTAWNDINDLKQGLVEQLNDLNI